MRRRVQAVSAVDVITVRKWVYALALLLSANLCAFIFGYGKLTQRVDDIDRDLETIKQLVMGEKFTIGRTVSK